MDLSLFESWSPALAYLLGWAITDGSISVSPRYSIGWELADLEPLEIMQRITGAISKIEHRRRGDCTYHRLRLRGQDVVEAFMAYGVEPRKTHRTKLPEDIPKEVMPHFLRGLLDGDGSIMLAAGSATNRAGYIVLLAEIASICRPFLDELRAITGAGVIGASGKPGHRSQKLRLKCSDAEGFLRMVYADSEGLRLSRKHAVWLAFLASGQTYRVKEQADERRSHPSEVGDGWCGHTE